jgi:hypothetical protein
LSGHTPGPWEVETVNSVYPLDICLAYEIPAEGRPIVIGFVHCDEEDDTALLNVKAAKANARLMAASPDLLAACEALLSYLDVARPGPDRPPYEAIVAARAALARAKGAV